MAPPRTAREPSIAYTPEYYEFIEKLRVYHEQRGTHFEPEPKVGAKHIDLLQLFKSVVERGGYDQVSEEKLAWRKLGQEFNLGTSNLPALAFQMKTAYYKNLAAYEITTIHKKIPPPREILEDTTAKGGGLLTRTLENYRPSTRRETGLGNEPSEASGDDGTPARERIASEETPGSGGRATRGLRQAPPQRILFQPETQSSRPSRNISSTSHAPSPQHHQNHNMQAQQGPRGASTSYTPSTNMDMSMAVANYEPRPKMPLTLQPVITSGNNPTEWARRQRALREAAAIQAGRPSQAPRGSRPLLPGVGFDGPNIYVRCLCALRSGIPAEQDYALHHLVKISMERGDKYKFDSFPGLAEALVDKVLEVGSLFYEVDWQVAYEDVTAQGSNIIGGLDGTPDILQRIASLQKKHVNDSIQTEEFCDQMLQINEGALTLRNMVMLEENARYISEVMPVRDFLVIALNLPEVDSVVELKHYALDIAEQLTKYLHFEENDPLYQSLLAQLSSSDRGAILTALRAISRISMNLEENNLLKGVPTSAIQNIIDWLLLHDEELVHACLDFLYQYTAIVDNVDFLISHVEVEPLVNQLVRLLSHGAKVIEKQYRRGREIKKPPPEQIATVPTELLDALLKFEEPERSSQWLRCLFEEDKDESITQIALWQAYQACFSSHAGTSSGPLLAAAEFIKNVSTTFAEKAAAQVQQGPVQRFIIKGIRIRRIPVDFKGVEYTPCLWKRFGQSQSCASFFMNPDEMYKHILKDHIGAPEVGLGKFGNTEGRFVCSWNGCQRFHAEPANKLSQLAQHIKVHLHPRPYGNTTMPKPNVPSYIVAPPQVPFRWDITPTDEHQEAAGIPLSAVLVLRNLARNISKTEAEENAMKIDGCVGAVSWVDRLFKPVEPKLFEVMAHSKTLFSYMTDLLDAVKES